MSQAGYNLATYKAECLFALEGHYTSASSYSYTDALLYKALNDAQMEVQSAFGVLQNVDYTTDLVAGTMTYAMPSSIFGTGIVSVAVKDVGGAFRPINRITQEEALRRYDVYGSGGESDSPMEWAMAPNAQQTLLLLPAPASSEADGLLVRYRAKPTPLYRCWSPPNYTITGTAGEDTVTFYVATTSTAPTAGKVLAGDEIGVVETTQSDGSTVTGVLPHRWYRIASLGTTSDGGVGLTYIATLDEAFEGATGASFVTAQVSDFEMGFPGKMRDALVLLAVAKIREMEGQAEQASVFRARAQGVLSQGLLDEDNTTLSGLRQANVLPGFYRNTWT